MSGTRLKILDSRTTRKPNIGTAIKIAILIQSGNRNEHKPESLSILPTTNLQALWSARCRNEWPYIDRLEIRDN